MHGGISAEWEITNSSYRSVKVATGNKKKENPDNYPFFPN